MLKGPPASMASSARIRRPTRDNPARDVLASMLFRCGYNLQLYLYLSVRYTKGKTATMKMNRGTARASVVT